MPDVDDGVVAGADDEVSVSGGDSAGPEPLPKVP